MDAHIPIYVDFSFSKSKGIRVKKGFRSRVVNLDLQTMRRIIVYDTVKSNTIA